MAAQEKWMAAIREQMKRRRISERKVTALAGVNRTTFRKALQGKTDITLNDLDSILKALGWEMDAHPLQKQEPA